MPRGRKAKPPRLYLRYRAGREPFAVILDNGKEHATGAAGEGADRSEKAQKALADYIARKYDAPIGPSHPDQMSIDRALEIYAEEHAPTTAAPHLIGYHIDALCPFWGEQPVSAIKGETCRRYIKSRKVKQATAKRELQTLGAAINYCHKEGYLTHVPRIWTPKGSTKRVRFLTRGEAARLIRAARRGMGKDYLPTFTLIGLYTGTRSAAILGLQWLPNTSGGWIDLEAGLLHRGADERTETNKRQPTCALPAKLLRHLRSVRQRTRQYVVERKVKRTGKTARIEKLRRSWAWSRNTAGLGDDVTPHTLRHTCVTWLLQRGVSAWEAGGYVGMSERMVLERYGHHAPDFQQKARTAV